MEHFQVDDKLLMNLLLPKYEHDFSEERETE